MAKQPTKLPSIPNLSQLSEAGRALSPPVINVPIDELSKERLQPKKEPATTPLGRPIVKPFAPDVQQRIEEQLSEEANKEIAEIGYSEEPIDRAYQMDVEEEGLLDEVLDDVFLKMTAPEPFIEDLAMGVSSPVKKKPSAKDITRYLNLNLGKYGIVFDVDELNNIEARAGDKSIKVDLSSGLLKSSEGQRSEIKRLKDFVVKEAVTPEIGVSISNENRIKNELAQELGVNQREAYDVYNRRKSIRQMIKYIDENEQNESAMASLEKKYKKGRFELLQDLKKELEGISPTADAYERDYILEVDKRLEAQVKESTAQAIKLRNIGESLTKSSADRFKAVTGDDLTLDNVKNFLKFANKDQYDSVAEILNDYAKGIDVKERAFNKYEDAKMYFNQKTNKQIQEETVGFIEGISNSIKNAYYSTKGAKEYVKYASGLITQEEANKRMAYYSSKPQLPLSKTQLMLMQRMEEEGTFDFLGYLSDPTVLLPAATTLAADALTQMITMTGGEMLSIQAAGGIISAGVGLLATRTPAGAAAGFRTWMSVAGTFNAYVGNVVSNVALEVGGNAFQAIKEKYTPEQILRGEWVNDPEIEDKAMKGLIKGGAIAGTEIILQAMLDKFRISSIASAANRVSRTVVKNAAFETIQEGGGEAIGQLAAYGELNGNEVVAEMLGAGGMVASNPFGFYREVYMQLRNNYYEDLADNMSKSRAFINNTGDDINKVQEWTGNMRKLGKITEETERKIVENIADIRQARIALSSLDDTDAQRTKTIEKGTNTKAEDRLADLYAAKRKLERTPALNKPLQQSIQNEIDSIVLNKKVPKEVLNLSPIIGTGPVYRVDGEYVGKRYLDMIVKRMPPSVLSRMNIEIENDDAMSRAVAEKIEDDVSFNAADYGDDKITFVANDLDGLPPRFRDKANYNNSTRKYEVEVDKSELAKPSKDVSDADYEAFKQGQVNDDVLASIADDISEGRRPTARQLEIYNANKDAINAKVGAEYTAVDPSSNYFGALRKVQKGGVVYAKNKTTGRVYEVKTKNALDLAYNSGARITAEKPVRKVSGEFTTQIAYGQKAAERGDEKFMLIVDGQEVLSPEGVDEFKKFAASVASRIGISVEFINDERALFKGKYIPSKKRAVINLAYANAETVFHEILGHPIIEAMRNDPEYSELYENLKNEIETTELGQEVLSNVKNKYKFEDPDDYIDEAIVTLLGIMTDKVFKEKQNTKLLGMLKEMLKKMASFVQSLVKNDFILLSDIPSNATIKDIATIIGASESKIVLPSEEIGMRDGREMYQVEGWHGSPYEFDKFTTEKIGTGEGAQAFGWGLYFTDLKSIAEMYAKKLSGDEYSYDGKLISKDAYSYLFIADDSYGDNFNENTIRDIAKVAINKIKKEYIPDLKEIAKTSRSEKQRSEMPNEIKKLKGIIKELENIISSKEIKLEKNKMLYKVTLHKGKTPDQYDWLEWDKPISDLNRNKINSQFEKENLPKEVSDSGANETMRLLGKKTDYKIYRPRPISGSGKDFYNDLTKYFYESGIKNPQKEASLFLLRAGIDGVKYPAESIARGVTSDTARGFNYVVFDENAITIDDRTQFQKTSEMGGASQEYVEKVLSTMMAKFNVPYQIVNEPSDSRLGWTSWDSMGNPTVYVNMAQKVGFDTPIHEYGHVFIHMIKNGNKNAWSQILKELKYGDGKQELERVKQEYPELDEPGALMEAAVSLLGKYGAEQLDPKTGEYRLAEKIWTAVKQVINDFLKASGINYKLNVAQVPASINAASTLQMLSLLLTDPDFNITGGGIGMAKAPFQLSSEANNMLQYISNRFETTVVSSDSYEDSKFIFSIKSLNRFKNYVVNKKFREKNNKLVESLKNKSDRNLLIDVLKNVRQILADNNNQNTDPLNDGELSRALSELDRLSGHSYGYSNAASFLGDLLLIHHGNLLKKIRNSGVKYTLDKLGVMNLRSLISGTNFDDVVSTQDKEVRTFLMPSKAEDVFADIISSIELDGITEFTDEDSANQDLVNYIAEEFAALTAIRGSSITGYAQETYIRVGSVDPMNPIGSTYYVATNSSGDFNMSDAIYRYPNRVAQSEEFDDLILGNIYGFSADYVAVNLLTGDAGRVFPSDDSVIEAVRMALMYEEKKVYDASVANQSNSRRGTFEYFHKGTNRMEGIEVSGTYNEYSKSIGVSFTNNGPTYSGYTDNKAGTTVMPLVVKKIIEMFSDVEYDSINFTPLSNDGVNQKIKQDSQGKNVNNRLNIYNVYAIRLFGEYSLIKIDDDYQRSIPIPEVFKTKVLRDVVQDQRPSSSNTEWAVNSAPSNVVELAKFLNHAFPGVEVFMSADEFNRMRENGELDMVGEVYGMTKDGKIYINPDVHNSESELFNTLIHEFGHIWLNYIKVHNSALYARGIELVKSTKEYKAELAKGKSPNQAADEALAIIIGNRGAEVVNPKMKNWLKSLWRYITKYLGPIETMTLDDFINTALSDLLSGKPIPQSSEAFEATLIPNPQFREDRDIIDIVRDARDRGYTDDAIKRYLQINKYEQDDIDLFMSGLGNVITNIKSPELMPFPPAFANVPGGYHEGLAVWNRVRTVGIDLYRNRKKRKAIKGQKGLGDTIVDAMMEALKAEPAYINATIDVKKQMMVGLLNSSDIRMSRNMRASLRRLAIEAKSIVRGGKIANTAKAQLVSYIIASLPKSKYTTKEVKSLLEKVKKATTTNMAQIIDEVRDTIATIKNRDLKSSISKMLETKITSKKKGVILGRTTVDAQVLLNALNGGMLMSEDSPAANIEAKIAEQSVALDTLLNEISAQPYEVQEEIQRNIEALTIAVKYNASLLMDDSNDGKTDVLKEVDDELKRILRGERAKFLEDKISKAKRRNELAAIMASDILQVDAGELMALIDDKEELDKLKQRLSDRTAKREQRFVQRFIDTIVGFLSGTTEDFTGIINKVSISAISLFEGLAYDMTVRRISDAQEEYDRLNMLTQNMLQDAAKRIFGPKWERVLANNAKQNISIPGFDQKFSVNQLYYIYNQYKNPANQESILNSFKDAASRYKEMGEDVSELDILNYILDILTRNHPDVVEWADWQVDEYFPAVYELYSPVYERVFGSPLPWERHYAGMLVREGVSSTPETSTLFSEFRLISPTVAGASTKSRVKSKSSIKFMDGDNILKKYTREMNFFASFEEAIRDVASIFNNQLVKKAIEATSGKRVYSSLVTMIERIQGTGYVDDPASIIITGTKQFAISKLAGNFRVFLSQMTTGMGYVSDIGAVNFGIYAGKILGDPFKIKSIVDEMKEYNATLKSRLDGIELNVLLGALGKTDDKFWIPQKWVQHMMILARLGDKYGILTGIPLYAYYKDKYLKQGVNEESAKKLAAEKFMTITSNVAQSNNPQNKGLTQTASGGIGDSILKSFTLFASQPLQYLRIEIMSIRNMYRILLSTGPKGVKSEEFAKNLRSFIAFHFVMPLFYNYVFLLGMPGILNKWDDDDEKDMILTGILGNITALILIGDVIESFKDWYTGKPWASDMRNTPFLMAAKDIVKSLQDYSRAKSDSKRQSAMIKIAANITDLSGIPAGTTLKYYKIIEKMIDGTSKFGKKIYDLFNIEEEVKKGPPPPPM